MRTGAGGGGEAYLALAIYSLSYWVAPEYGCRLKSPQTEELGFSWIIPGLMKETGYKREGGLGY